MKKFLSLFFVVLMCVTMILPLYAANEISPRYNNTFSATANFDISSSGTATASVSYTGYPGYATGATITCKIERRNFIMWVEVAGAEWTDTVVGSTNVVQHSCQLSVKDTYRLTYEITVYGTGGDPDVISGTIEKKYQ